MTDTLGQAPPLALPDLVDRLGRLGVAAGDLLMVHSSLGSLGYVLGGAATVVRALRAAIGEAGTLVMPAFSPAVSDPAAWVPRPFPDAWLDHARSHLPAFDPATTPTTMGAVAETFRCWPGVRRSRHPQVSVCAAGPLAAEIVGRHPDAWGEGAGSPFERLTALDARLLLLGVGFNRATMLHYAESRVPHGRRKTRRFPVLIEAERRWIEVPDVGDDLDTHFPPLGAAYLAAGRGRQGKVGAANAVLVPAADLVDFATRYLARVLAAPA